MTSRTPSAPLSAKGNGLSIIKTGDFLKVFSQIHAVFIDFHLKLGLEGLLKSSKRASVRHLEAVPGLRRDHHEVRGLRGHRDAAALFGAQDHLLAGAKTIDFL